MHSDKKITKEDTWRPADLKRHIRDGGHGEEYVRRADENERRHRGGESIERRHRDPEKESRRERDKHRERDSTRERRRPQNEEDRHLDRRKEGSRDRRGDREEKDRDREKRRERVVDENKHSGDHRDKRDRRREREEKQDRERDGEERSRDKEKERVSEKDGRDEGDRDKRREERDRERRREEREREHRAERERRRHEEGGDGEQRDRRRERSDKDKQERHRDRKHPELKEERGDNEERRRDKEEKERRHKDTGNHDEKRRRDTESREQRDSRESDGHRHGDRERAEGHKHRERRHREEDDRERHHRDRTKESDGHRHGDRERVEGDKREERRHGEEEDGRERHRRDRTKESDGHRHGDRERAEGDKRGERRHGEEEDGRERNRRDRTKESDGHRHGDRERVGRDTRGERRRGEEEDGRERNHRDRTKETDGHRHGDREQAGGEKRGERRHGEEEDGREINHRDRMKESDGHRHGDRERVEGDKRGERRHAEEEDRERTKTDSSNKTASDSSHSRETKNTETEVANDDNVAEDQDYEDDFEKLDYEEDFEELDESDGEGEDEKEQRYPEVVEEREELTAQRREEIKAIQRAMDEENERVGTALTRQSTGTEEEEEGTKWSRESEKKQSRASQRGKFIDFVSAKQREVSKKVASKQKKRSTELLRLIDLDFSLTFSLLDLPPVSEYDMYIKTFGTANTKQAYVQCNEDNADRDIQTEETEVCEKWTQHPAEIHGACGDPSRSQEAGDRSGNEWSLDSQRLTAFVRSASQVMVVLLEEDQAERNSLRKPRTQSDSLSFSDGSLQLNTKLPFLYGREVSLVLFSQVQRHTMMSVHRPTAKPSAVRLDSCAIICIWNIWEPSKPQKILVYESEVQCCCFSPGKATLVFAGTSVGSVALWDLREHDRDHYRLTIGDNEWTLRQPTFSTDAVLAGSGHLSSVSSLEVVPSTIAGGQRPADPLLASEEESSGLSFQLASLDENGVLHFWVVVELPKASDAGSQTDLGLRPGGKVKLLHSSSLLTVESISLRDVMKTGPLQTLHLKFHPADSNHFFIGTNMGLVTHGTTHGLKAPPKFYGLQEAGARPADVTSIHFSPFRHNLFLVGCGDGSVRLHAVSHERPVAEWTNGTAGEAVVSLQWAQTRPSVFCVLDAASNLHIWDLLKSDTEPVITERMTADRVTAMAVFGDSRQQNTYSGIALAYESGKIEMQYFTRSFTVPAPEEEEKLDCTMNDAF